MKVLLIYRKNYIYNHSIESIFNLLYSLSQEKIDIHKFYCPFPSSILGSFANMIYLLFYNADVYHITGDVHYLSIILPSKRTILTIHDVGHIKYSFPKSIIYNFIWFRIPISFVKYIATPSLKTKNDILAKFNINSDKIYVIPNPIKFDINYKSDQSDSKPYRILIIGLTENKNISRQLQALLKFKTNVELLIVGFLTIEIKKILDNNFFIYKNVFNISEEELIKYYRTSKLLMFASIFEGFGLPIIEAQSQGLAVITSNLSPMKDIAGEGAILVDPFNVNSIENGIEILLNDKNLYKKVITLGYLNAEKFSKKYFFDSYLSLYKDSFALKITK